ncbi:MAG: sulfite exporter TauE/SafE family protein [Bacteroidales bacterium]|nr:sulfite exporter TauE/SafE family protein [Bacteroidales bacterium]MBK7175145.1 sulfite exporter TauE/SafE family protein [Bacteroidales bacterium]
MSLQAIVILLLIGLAAGIFGGMVGLGGGVIMIPALIYFMGMSQMEAQGTSLAVMIPPVGIFAVMNYYKAGNLNFKYALLIAIAFTIGGYFGSKLALNLPVSTVKKIFGFAMIIIALRMIIKS